MTKRIILYVIGLCLVLAMLGSCTETVELCDVKNHPHKSYLNVVHDWSGVGQASKPDSMLVFVERLVERWNTGYRVSTRTNQSDRLYVADAGDEIPDDAKDDDAPDSGDIPDSGDTPDGGDTPDSGDTPKDDTAPKDDDANGSGEAAATRGTRQASDAVLPYATIQVRPGEYEVMSFSRNVSEFNYKGLDGYVYDKTENANLDSIYVEYKAYSKDDPRLKRYLSSWTDFNPYSKYVQTDVHAFYYAISDPIECPLDQHVPLSLKPYSYMQTVTFRFSVEKQMDADNRFAVDSMHVEIGGVPYRIYLMNGEVDVRKTYKLLMHPIYLEGEQKDSYTNKKMQCETYFYAPGIVPPISSETALGPGIAVVKIFLHTEKQPDVAFMVNARINLFRTISKSPMIKMNDEMTAGVLRSQYHVIKVDDVLRLNAKEIIKAADGQGSDLDRWESCGKGTIVDI